MKATALSEAASFSSVMKVQKRDGRVVDYDRGKIANAVFKALKAAGEGDWAVAGDLSGEVEARLNGQSAPTVEQIQDIVETVLMESGFSKTAKAYILYREKRREIRECRNLLLDSELDAKLSANALTVLESRYLKRDEKGKVIETPAAMFRRVAKTVALSELTYSADADVKKTEDEFYKAMANLLFLPNSPSLMNGGLDLGQLSACFVLPVEDSMEGIFDAVKYMALVQKTGGGTGFSFSRLRPRGDIVKSTQGVASGPIVFMKVFNEATEAVKQGGRRRGANMAVLRVDHPDIVGFIQAKEREGELSNFNISVAVTDVFMKALDEGGEFNLVNPRTKENAGKLDARELFRRIASAAWRNGEPGMLFIDEINRHNPTPQLGEIESTNPCAEQPLLPYESCNLGSINLARMVVDGRIDYARLKETVGVAVRFLDNIIDVNRFPLPQIEEMTKANRKIGLGVMGFADMLIQLGIPYDSEDAVVTAEEVMSFINEEARKASASLAEERGVFPNFNESIYAASGVRVRNATVTTIAPTGSLSIIANCSSGIEPLFSVCLIRKVLGTELVEVNPVFEKIARERGFCSEELMQKVAEKGTVRGVEEVPEDVQRLFVTAHEIAPEWHLRMQAAFQKYTDNAVSKTVNLPNEATVEDVEKIFMLAYKLGCKGVTVYRDRSRSEQVLNKGVGDCGGTSVSSCKVCSL